MSQQESDQAVQGDFCFGAIFEEVKHQLLVSWGQIEGRENYICIEVSR